MKKLIILTFFLQIAFMSFAQKHIIEAKINPIGFAFGMYSLALEYGINDRIGIDIAPNFRDFTNVTNIQGLKLTSGEKGAGLQISAKYYIKPNKGIDKLGFGPFIDFLSTDIKTFNKNYEEYKFNSTTTTLGLLGTLKFVKSNGLLFEFSLGEGVVVSYKDKNLTPTGVQFDRIKPKLTSTYRIAIGYRFGGGMKR